jgi:hypothetical protein
MLPGRAGLDVTVPRKRNRRAPEHVTVHSTPDGLPPEDITTIDGIPVTTPARTLLDLAALEPQEVVERCLDYALRRRLVTLRFLDSWLEDPRRKRQRGWGILRRFVDARMCRGVTESPLEDQVLRLLEDADLPTPMLQYVVREGNLFVARPDFAYPDQLVAIEAEGFRYHGHRQAFDGDRARGNELEARGWHVLRITSKHLMEDPGGVVAWVRRALGRYS